MGSAAQMAVTCELAEACAAESHRRPGVTGKIALICPVPEAPKYGVTTSAGRV